MSAHAPLHLPPASAPPGWIALGLLAVLVPSLATAMAVPSTTFLNQALAVAGWGALIAALPWQAGRDTWRAASPLLVALVCMATAVLLSGGGQALTGLSTSSLAMLGAAAVTLAAGVALPGRAVFVAFAWGLLAAGLVGLGLAAVQHFGPAGFGDPWIAAMPGSGRAGGNLRQPNHLSSLMLEALAACVFLARQPGADSTPARGRWRDAALVTAMVLLVAGVVLTASRTGLVCLVLLALWGAFDKRLTGTVRLALVALPAVYALWWFGFDVWAEAHSQTFVGEKQMNAADMSSSRFAIWANTRELIAQNPWFGVGWGEFNFAWTLTPFPNRPVAFFDHTHNLPLQLWVELGLPLGTLVLLLLGWAYVRAALNLWHAKGTEAAMRGAAFLMVTMMGVHSLLEYPLWYAYFLLPTAFAWGVCLRPLPPEATPGARRAAAPDALGAHTLALRLAGMAMAAGAAFAVMDYQRVVRIFVPPENGASLDARITAGEKSVFFDHHAHYAAVTTAVSPDSASRSFAVATHFLLDARLMMAWARALDAAGDTDKARHVAARLKEFRNAQAASFFAVCGTPAAPEPAPPFQCEAPQRAYTHRDFR